MARVTGTYRTTVVGEEKIKAFIPHALPPANPPLLVEEDLAALQGFKQRIKHAQAYQAAKALRIQFFRSPERRHQRRDNPVEPPVDICFYGFAFSAAASFLFPIVSFLFHLQTIPH